PGDSDGPAVRGGGSPVRSSPSPFLCSPTSCAHPRDALPPDRCCTARVGCVLHLHRRVTLDTLFEPLDRPPDLCHPALVPGGPSDELRPVTVLFADVVGSTGLGERLGPDEVKSLIGECVSRMSRTVEEFGGTIQAYMGDGICSYFGVPAAHEDDEERAARAALRILQVVAEY